MPHGQRRVSSGWRTKLPSHRESLVADFTVALSLAAVCNRILPGARFETRAPQAMILGIPRLIEGQLLQPWVTQSGSSSEASEPK